MAIEESDMTERTELLVRLSCFGGVLLVMLFWEWKSPRRVWTVPRGPRWASNLSLVAINVVLARLIIPLTAVGAAAFAAERQVGLLQVMDWPAWLELLLAVLLLDGAIYFQHVLFHAVPLLWRFHLVHHADLDFDVTTGEILLSAIIKLAAVLLIGPTVLAVISFEVILNAMAMFNHGNIDLPRTVDRWLRWLVVTPDMHRVHHSIIHQEMNSNFGFNFPWWDVLFGTYRDQPARGHESMTIGLAHLRDERRADRLGSMFMLPFRFPTSDALLAQHPASSADLPERSDPVR
jgi:sterol desaturase/sphingolipid hydroxylase (fatty acid hydroxylase superfamily)